MAIVARVLTVLTLWLIAFVDVDLRASHPSWRLGTTLWQV